MTHDTSDYIIVGAGSALGVRESVERETIANACCRSRSVGLAIPGPASQSACQAHRQPGSESALRVEAGGEHRRQAQMRGCAHPKGRPKFITQLEADVRRP